MSGQLHRTYVREGTGHVRLPLRCTDRVNITDHEDELTLLNCIKPAWSTICRWLKEKSLTTICNMTCFFKNTDVHEKLLLNISKNGNKPLNLTVLTSTNYTCIAKQNAISFQLIKTESSWLKLHSPSATV